MIHPKDLYELLQEKDVSFFSGVPDSLLKPFLKYIQDHSATADHIITANEGLAVALATGYHFSTGKIPLVYLQNSGLGNIINPLTSLADREMSGIPILFMIGWRGRPGVKDEPQHQKMGRITLPMLEVLDIPYYIMDGSESAIKVQVTEAIHKAESQMAPVALVVPEGIFESYRGIEETNKYSLQKEDVISRILQGLTGNETVICTTGKIGREFYEQNRLVGNKCTSYFLSVGAMGHANHIALAVNIHSGRKVIMLDGDGALLMHLGALPAIAHFAPGDMIHIVLNNGRHESVGGQPTEAFFADLCGVAKSCGYPETLVIDKEATLHSWIEEKLGSKGLQFVEIRVSGMGRNDLPRPGGSPQEWKKEFMKTLGKKN